ncbi:hypothetical protein [Streptomyces guryensis]|uniref:Uncharacterized protein n=1 Tax=Streptomyces guryensis TaxID=2886947 RepID=A0A9Q3Z8X7_9ACTN|nr:hypothetical protein [Streptomyces guryensis]MCD9879701.1 hypothetical protein [Streptomyces guryensis]
MDMWDTRTRGQHPLVDHVFAVAGAADSLKLSFFADEVEGRAVSVVARSRWDGLSQLAGIDGQSRALSTLLATDRRLADLRALTKEITEDAVQSRRLRTRLLATAEQDTGLPSIVFAPEDRPCSSTRPGWAWARHASDVLEYVAEDGAAHCALRFSHERPWIEEDPRWLAEAALAEVTKQFLAIRDIALAALGLLIGPTYSFAGNIPPNETSPCGVLRLAAPIVPGAPSLRSWPHEMTMTLAA